MSSTTIIIGVMKAAEAEELTGVISQDPLTLEMNVMKIKKIGFQKMLGGILKMNGEGREDPKTKFTTTTRYKSISVLVATVETIIIIQTVITTSGSKEEAIGPLMVLTALTLVVTGLSMRKSLITTAHQVAGLIKGTTDTTSMMVRAKTTPD